MSMFYSNLRASETQRIIGVGFEKPHQHRTFLAVGRLSTSGSVDVAISTKAPVVGNATTAVAGSNQPVGIMSPYLGLNYCIALQGIYPSRD
jgi:microcystin-dependent protein